MFFVFGENIVKNHTVSVLSLDFFLCLKHCYKDFFLVALCSSTLRHDFFSCSNSRFINKFQYNNIYIWVKIPIQYLINQYFDFRMEYMNFPHFSQKLVFTFHRVFRLFGVRVDIKVSWEIVIK